MKKVIVSIALGCALLTSGCDLQSFEDKCKEQGGTVEKDRESCTKTTTKRVNGKSTTKRESGYRTEEECFKDGEEIDEHEGTCL